MHTCPHCGEPGITWLQKAMLGPVGARSCKSCGQRVSVAWGPSYRVAIPGVALLTSAMFFLEGWMRIAGIVAVAVVGTLIHDKWVPLRKK